MESIYVSPYKPQYPKQQPFGMGPSLADITNLWQNQQNRRSQQRSKYYSKYCWTHAGCGHFGLGCKHKKEGHKDEATFRNKMGGSTENWWR